ncbi:hypothetical protein EOD39_12663 [Acipenser ruthenus]|uniref:Uncharacterized protein n=1 Tax=Acipenser ruthenus TaxID=7906 RepID=A0A662YQI3_ACIRT|nr:hypothetical protein EOD39_12663 [Acipenser ruthenus]
MALGKGEGPQAEEKRKDKMAGWQTVLQAEGHCFIIVEEEDDPAGMSSHTKKGEYASSRKQRHHRTRFRLSRK